MGVRLRHIGAGCAALVIGLLACAAAPQAQPARDRILDDVRVSESDGCAFVTISFNFPVRYVRHFPYSQGNELRIQFEPINISPEDREFLFERESLRPWDREIAALLEVAYEGDIEGGPYLTLLFDQSVTFLAGQGLNFRSLSVITAAAGAPTPCTVLPPTPKRAP